jgi:hypothetical protein
MDKPMNYDPNLTNSGSMATQRVRLTFGQWHWRRTVETTVGGNCTGFEVISTAIESVWEDLPGADHDSEIALIWLANAEGDELLCEDDDRRGSDWLKDMLISAEIVAIEPDSRHD